MRFAVAGEGLTDFKVLKNLLIGFFKDKNLPVTKLRPKDKEPHGWGNVLQYISTLEFREEVEAADYVIIQIDTDKCEEWNENLKAPVNSYDEIDQLIKDVIAVLVKRIGSEFYQENRHKILFAISVHDIECWLLPFISNKKSDYKKVVGCANAVEEIANKRGFSINEKNYGDGVHYEELSKEMKDNKTLKTKYKLNRSLKVFVDSLSSAFPDDNAAPVAELPEG